MEAGDPSKELLSFERPHGCDQDFNQGYWERLPGLPEEDLRSGVTLRGSLLPELLGAVLWKSIRKGSHHLLHSYSSFCCG